MDSTSSYPWMYRYHICEQNDGHKLILSTSSNETHTSRDHFFLSLDFHEL